MTQILLDPAQRPWWWSERDERVSHMAALMRAQGTLSSPPPGARLGIVSNEPDPLPEQPRDLAETEADFDTGLGGFAHARNLGFGRQRADGDLADALAPPPPIAAWQAAPPWASSPAARLPTPAAPPSRNDWSLNPAAAGLALPAVALVALAAIGIGGYAAYQWWHAKSPEEQDAFLREWTPRVLRQNLPGNAAGAGGASPPTSSGAVMPMLDPAPELPPLPGFAAPIIAPWQEQFPGEDGVGLPGSLLHRDGKGNFGGPQDKDEREEACEKQFRIYDRHICKQVGEEENLGLRPRGLGTFVRGVRQTATPTA
jgi:hypothetical protein